jgi:hypothetical protein
MFKYRPFQSLNYVQVYDIYKSEVYTYNSQVGLNKTATYEFRDILCRYGFNDIWISQDVVDEDNFLCEFIKQRIIDCFVSEAVANSLATILTQKIYVLEIAK